MDKLLIGLNRAEVGKICLIIFSELPMQNQPDECKPCFLWNSLSCCCLACPVLVLFHCCTLVLELPYCQNCSFHVLQQPHCLCYCLPSRCLFRLFIEANETFYFLPILGKTLLLVEPNQQALKSGTLNAVGHEADSQWMVSRMG